MQKGVGCVYLTDEDPENCVLIEKAFLVFVETKSVLNPFENDSVYLLLVQCIVLTLTVFCELFSVVTLQQDWHNYAVLKMPSSSFDFSWHNKLNLLNYFEVPNKPIGFSLPLPSYLVQGVLTIGTIL